VIEQEMRMTALASTERPPATTRPRAAQALQASATLWFAVAVIGQWAFVYYIALFYGPTFASGDFAAWNRNKMLIDGHIAGDPVGNLFFAAHVALAAVLTFGGALQLVPQIRARAIVFHRWNGRVFLFAAAAAAAGGLHLVWVRGTTTGAAGNASITLNAALIFAFALLAFRAVRSKDIAAHQRWTTRLFLAVNGVWFIRVGFMAWMMLTQRAFGTEPFFTIWGFGSYLVPLAVYELYWRAKKGEDASAKLAVAGGIFALTLVMGAGIAAAVLFMWSPLL
jgi:hypothetical protein